MPIYLYRCTDCDTTFEIMHKMSDPPVDSCEKCGGSTRRVFGATGIIFKGSGFYTTDYARDNGKETAAPSETKKVTPPCSAACGGSCPA